MAALPFRTRISTAVNVLLGRSTGRLPLPGGQMNRGYGTGMGIRVQPLLPGAKYDYAREAGDIWRNTTVAACLGWLQDNFGQATIGVYEPSDTEGQPDELLAEHPLTALLKTPNEFFSAEELWDAMLLSDKVDGNTYLLKARGAGGAGPPQELWYVPHWMMGPWSDPNTDAFIDKYWYQPGDGQVYWVPIDQVVHIKSGIDPYDTRIGCARLKYALRSIVGVNRADTYVAAIIGNGGPIRVFVPDGAEEVDEATADGIRYRLERATSGEDAGTLQIMSLPGHFESAGSGPAEMALGELLDRPEANICAMLGVNAMVTGLAVGNNTRTFTNLQEAESQAWTNGLIPTQERFARAIARQLLPDFPGSDKYVVRWDRSKVVALSEDASDKVTRASTAFTSQLLPRDRCLAIAGESPVGGEEGELYWGEATQAAKDEAAAIAQGNGPGTDQTPTDDEQEPPDEAGNEDAADEADEPAVKAHGYKRTKLTGGRWVTTDEGHHLYIKGNKIVAGMGIQARHGGRRHPTDPHHPDRALVKVDTHKLDSAVHAAAPGMHVGPGGTGISARQGSYHEAKRNLESGKSVPAPKVSIGHDGKPSIDDGRHQFAAKRDAGHEHQVVSVHKGAVDRVHHEYGATATPKTPAPTTDTVRHSADHPDHHGTATPSAPVHIGGERTYHHDEKSVGNHIDAKGAGVNEAHYHTAFEAIHQVHRDGGLSKIAATTDKLKSGNHGEYRADSFTPRDIALSETARHPAWTAVHETGHFIDHKALGTDGVGFASHGDGHADKVMAAIMKTPEAKKVLSEAKSTKGELGKHARYLAQPEEIFARAYAQHIATKTQHPELLAGLNHDRSGFKTGHKQWSDASFAPVSKAFDEMFKAKGWHHGS